MSEDPTPNADKSADADADAAGDLAGEEAKRPTPSAQAASRARRIGGRPAPGRRPSPTASSETKTDADAETKPAEELAARRSGMRAARAAATERSVETKQSPTSLTKRTPRASAPVPKAGSEREALRRRLDLMRWIPAGVLGAAVLVLAGLCVGLGHGVWWATKSADVVRGEVLSAAKTCTATVSAYDYRKLAQAKKDGLACATGKFKKDYATAMDTIIAKEAPATKTTQTVQVAKAGIEQVSSDGRQWTVLILGQHTVVNVNTQKGVPRLDVLSVRVTMEKVGNKWLIAKLGAPS